ncbi:MAG: chemotaxis protein CheA, partial [Acidobacteria bacterium]|nr:chemotaxis protein CheA [Acidobacteriota bacterium]NIO58569.1 chemotaxis protein CheA [Acidobacteriota bacterium]NIQ84328.1 chemotaxis protein CheA [Acidobacteriota bacterium]
AHAEPEPEREPQPGPEPVAATVPTPGAAPVSAPGPAAPQPAPAPAAAERGRVVETMRVDTDRLDALMNLAGELVVNRARFVQVAGEVGPAFGKRYV